jgi:ABC-type glutathione transport system ATPase component
VQRIAVVGNSGSGKTTLGRTLVAAGRDRAELWNGNRERWRNLMSFDEQESVIMWSVRRHERYRVTYAAAATDPRWAHLTFVRVASDAQARRLLDALRDHEEPEREASVRSYGRRGAHQCVRVWGGSSNLGA